MKKVLLMVVLAVTAIAVAQQPTQPGQQPGNVPTNQKTIKDPAEYNAYITALNTQDPAQKAAAMEAFVKQYPQSVVLVDALEQAMGAYQQAGNQAKVEDTAKRLLQLDPNNIRALAIVTYIDRGKATNGDQAALKAVCDESQRGLQALPSWQKPQEVNDADFQKLKNQMANIFQGAAGFCALQAKNLPVAQERLANALKIDPTNFGDTFQLAVAELSSNPMNLTGFWHCAKAINLAQSQNNAAGAKAVNDYCQAMYRNFHGSTEGWAQFVQQSGAQAAPPATIPITPKPTPCDIAVDAVKNNDVTTLSFSDREFILSQKGCSPAGTEAADKVWQSIQTMQKNGEARLEIPVKVISATTDALDVAVSEDNQGANKPDMHVVLEKPVTKPPAPGTMTKVTGVITNYTPNPFLFTMEKGALPATKATPAHRPPAKKGKKKK